MTLLSTAQARCRAYQQSCDTVTDVCDEGHYCRRDWGTSGKCARSSGDGFPCGRNGYPAGTCEPGFYCQSSEELSSSP